MGSRVEIDTRTSNGGRSGLEEDHRTCGWCLDSHDYGGKACKRQGSKVHARLE